MARQADAAHKVRLDNRAPIVVGDLFEWLRLVNTEIVNQNIDRRKSSRGFDRCLGVREIGHERFEHGVRSRPENGRDGFRHALFSATVHDNACAFSSERSGNGETNSRRWSR